MRHFRRQQWGSGNKYSGGCAGVCVPGMSPCMITSSTAFFQLVHCCMWSTHPHLPHLMYINTQTPLVETRRRAGKRRIQQQWRISAAALDGKPLWENLASVPVFPCSCWVLRVGGWVTHYLSLPVQHRAQLKATEQADGRCTDHLHAHTE